PAKDLAHIGGLLNDAWEALPLEKKTEKGAELIAGMGIAGLGEKWHQLAKSGKLVDLLDGLAEGLAQETAANKAKAAEQIKLFVNDLLDNNQLVADTGIGGKVRVPTSRADTLGETSFQMKRHTERAKDWPAELAREVPSSKAEAKSFRGDKDIY